MAWYYKDGEQAVGPIDKAQLQQLIKAGKINAQTAVRRADGDAWQPLVVWIKGKQPPKAVSASSENAPPAAAKATPPDKKTPPPPPAGRPPARPPSDRSQDSSKSLPFTFNGSGGEYFKIWIVNILLSVLTLGIYSAWAKVRRKQYFYGNTEINGASFQYLADPVKILKGRIIVFVGFAIYSLINTLLPILSLLFFIVFLPLLPWFVVRSLSFNARNSALRNIRFNFHGTYWQAAKVFIFWPLLVPFTLGAIAPYVFYRQKKFIVDNGAYGTTRFDFKATAKDYYVMVFKFLIPFVICMVATAAIGSFYQPLEVLIPIVAVIFYLYAFAYFAVRSNNLFYNSSALAGHGFAATMGIKDYAIILVTNTLAVVLTLGLFHPFAKVRAYRYKISQLALAARGDLDQFVAAEQKQVSAVGDEVSDFMDFDLGL